VQDVAYPLIEQFDILGGLELASFRKFTAIKQGRTDELLPLLAMSLQVLSRNIGTKNCSRVLRNKRGNWSTDVRGDRFSGRVDGSGAVLPKRESAPDALMVVHHHGAN
jgi:hypothetical protein